MQVDRNTGQPLPGPRPDWDRVTSHSGKQFFALVFPEQIAITPDGRTGTSCAGKLGHADPLSLLPEDWSWWLRNRPGPEGSLGWPDAARGA